jgi:hypothetical protein
VGSLNGLLEGSEDGPTDGIDDGSKDGSSEGSLDGLLEGFDKGCEECKKEQVSPRRNRTSQTTINNTTYYLPYCWRIRASSTLSKRNKW